MKLLRKGAIRTTAGIGFLVVMNLWLAMLYWQWHRAQDLATRQRQGQELEVQSLKTQTALDEQTRSYRTALRHQAYLGFEQAVRWCETGEVDRGLQIFCEALTHAVEIQDANLERAIRCNLTAWRQSQITKVQSVKCRDICAVTVANQGKWVVTTSTDQKITVRETITNRELIRCKPRKSHRWTLTSFWRKHYPISLGG